MCAWTVNKLYATVEEDLHPIIIANEKNVFEALNALETACGKRSVVVMCDKLFHLVNLTYVPGTSLSQHISAFRRQYTALTTSFLTSKNFMSVSTGMAAAFLLRSLHQDKSLTSLVQSLYNLEPLTFEKVFDQLSVEDGQKETNSAESAYSLSQSKRKDKQVSSRPYQVNSHRGIGNSRGRGGSSSRGIIRGVVPTRPAPDTNLGNNQFAKMFRQQMKLYMNGQANLVQDDEDIEEDEADVVDEGDEIFYDHPEDSGFMISDKLNVNVDSPGDNKSTLIFDSGATKTTVCNYDLLIDPTPVTKAMNTYSGRINITHVGKMNLSGTIIHPVYYAPNGPRNLISLSQLKDHGLSIYLKSRLVLI
jgi:hypothetical protein